MANTTVMNISKGPHSAKVIRQKEAGDSKAYFMAKFYTNGRYRGEDDDYHGWEDVNDTIATAKSILHQLASHSGHGHHELIIDDKRRGSNLRENVLLEYKKTYADGLHDSDKHVLGGQTMVVTAIPSAVAAAYYGGTLAKSLGLPYSLGAVPGGIIGTIGGAIAGSALTSLLAGKSPSQRALIKQNKLPVGSKVRYTDPNNGKSVTGTVVKHNKVTLKTTVQREHDGKSIIVSSHHLDPA